MTNIAEAELTIQTYAEYKKEVDTELQRTAESFVKIGYLLKLARDTDILKDSPYNNVTEFAKKEYDIDKTVVSKWIHINDRFSEGGYSDVLQEKYRGFGYSKLAIMLQIPDSINEELTPSYSKAEIQAIKDEVDAENRITDIEVCIEEEKPAQGKLDTNLEKVMHQLLEDDKGLFEKAWKLLQQDYSFEDLIETLAPSGEAYHSVRVQGLSRFGLIVKQGSNNVSLTNIRSGIKEEYSIEELVRAIKPLVAGDRLKTAYELTYKKPFLERDLKSPESKPSKVTKAAVKHPEKESPKTPEKLINTFTEADSENEQKQVENSTDSAKNDTEITENSLTEVSENTGIIPKDITVEEKEPEKNAKKPEKLINTRTEATLEEAGKAEVAPVQPKAFDGTKTIIVPAESNKIANLQSEAHKKTEAIYYCDKIRTCLVADDFDEAADGIRQLLAAVNDIRMERWNKEKRERKGV